jgi:integrase
MIDRSPAEGLRIGSDGVADKDRRLPFSAEHLRTIFAPEHYPSRDKPAKFWVPLLSAYTGCRLGELVQLQARDIHQIDGILAISINAEGEKRVKTAHALRTVPLHKHLLKLGFDAFIESVREHGPEAKLFPELWTAQDPAGAFSKWFARYLDDIGIRDKKLVFHSWRHGLRSALSDAGVPADRIDAICGWSGSGRGMQSIYSTALKIKLLAAAINKIDFDFDPALIQRSD